jgi:hypothetical protein
MGQLYSAVPNVSNAVVEVATGTAIKTLLQIGVPSTTGIRIVAWGISFDGVSASAAPGVITLVDVDVAATVTALAPDKWGNVDAPASLCISGTAATGYNASAEGSITASRIFDSQNVHPQTGYSVWFPERPRVKSSRFLRIRALFAADVNAIPWIIWQEPE